MQNTHYYQERGYRGLDLEKAYLTATTGKPSKERIKAAYEKMKSDGKEVFIGVNTRNLRYYMQGVRDEEGNLIGFFERFELNQQK